MSERHSPSCCTADGAAKASKSAGGSVPRDGLISWFESRNAGPSWTSSVGEQPYVGMAAGGNVKVSTKKGHGAAKPIRYIHGDTAAAFMFGKVIWKQWSMCSISRYTGSRQKRLLVAERAMHGAIFWAHGHYNGNTGVAHYGKWVSVVDNMHTMTHMPVCR